MEDTLPTAMWRRCLQLPETTGQLSGCGRPAKGWQGLDWERMLNLMRTPTLRTQGPHLLKAASTLRSPQFLNPIPGPRAHQTCLRSHTEFGLKLNLSPKPHNPWAGMLAMALGGPEKP